MAGKKLRLGSYTQARPNFFPQKKLLYLSQESFIFSQKKKKKKNRCPTSLMRSFKNLFYLL